MNRIAIVAAGVIAVLTFTGTADRASSTGQRETFNQRWQDVAQAPAARPKMPVKPAPKATPTPAQKLPVSLEQALYLIRSTLLTLNDANRSGNYTVLRDLAAPAFQDKNNAADLAHIFTDLRQRHIDLFEAALMAPQLALPPHLEKNGMLRLTGDFPTQPLQIDFDLLFENVGGQWRLYGISIRTPEVAPQANAPAAKP